MYVVVVVIAADVVVLIIVRFARLYNIGQPQQWYAVSGAQIKASGII